MTAGLSFVILMKPFMLFKSSTVTIVLIIGTLAGASLIWLYTKIILTPPSFSEHEAGFDTPDIEPSPEPFIHPRLRGLDTWRRPEGPWRVTLQAGHWKAAEAPDELKNLRISTGTSYGRITEWEVVLAIAEKTKVLLEASGVQVEILPTTIPPNHWSDIFVSIHADGNLNPLVSGYKVAAPRRDETGQARTLVQFLEAEYGLATGLSIDANITRTMRGYYAFNWRRYDHSIHPLSVAAIVETGFLSNANDRRIIVNAPEKAARGIASGITQFLGLTTKTTSETGPTADKEGL